jgi:hypothetical protein
MITHSENVIILSEERMRPLNKFMEPFACVLPGNVNLSIQVTKKKQHTSCTSVTEGEQQLLARGQLSQDTPSLLTQLQRR